MPPLRVWLTSRPCLISVLVKALAILKATSFPFVVPEIGPGSKYFFPFGLSPCPGSTVIFLILSLVSAELLLSALLNPVTSIYLTGFPRT